MSKPVAIRSSSRLKARETSRKRSREDEEKEDEEGKNEGSAAENLTTSTTQKSTTTTTSTTLKTISKIVEDATCCVCIVNEPSANFRPCGYAATCRVCTKKLIDRCNPCPFCRKPIEGYDVGKWQTTTGGYGLWPTSLQNLSQLASGEGFNKYFQDLFNCYEAPYLKWKGYFDLLGIVVVPGGETLEQQVLKLTTAAGIEDMAKLKALATLCSQSCFDDPSLRVVVYRRALGMRQRAK
ncbi:hypothetical protein TrLO_g6996 [Triparma laevis f. longispina]|uniref:RING-type domain-containing protein n=1 Tax=Triparma laevis f. longispina TaxID=1714387 RepID=A0A9W7FBI8_9STRA|nr:hypothetical protein TrLO_g6996 [Triparma laevis f. longispina]